MTVSSNTIDALNRNQSRVPLPVTTNLTVNQGDLVYWDGTNATVTPVTAKTQILSNAGVSPFAAFSPFLGVALQANAGIIYPGDADKVGIEVLVRGTVWLNTTAADVYTWFTPVTVGADSQTITSTAAVATVGTTYNLVGYAIPPVATSPRANQATPVPETVTGAAGVRIQVLLAPQHPYAASL